MEALKRKWNSCRGASILLAMLFLLVCMMVGASIVVAADSNAGKYDSNKTEQQKYLAVSSAMTMLVEGLQSVKYEGQYNSTVEKVMEQVPDLDDETGEQKRDEEGNLLFKDGDEVDYCIYTYTQKPGELTGCSWLTNDLLPLRDYLDYIFAENFKRPESGTSPDDVYRCISRLNVSNSDKFETTYTHPNSYTLTFTAPSGYGGLDMPVEILVELRPDGSILLTATTKDKDSGAVALTMKALLRPKPNIRPEKQLVLKFTGDYTYEWELESIFKEEVKPGDTP